MNIVKVGHDRQIKPEVLHEKINSLMLASTFKRGLHPLCAEKAARDIGCFTPPHAPPWVLRYGENRIVCRGMRFAVIPWGKIPTVEQLTPVYPNLVTQDAALRFMFRCWMEKRPESEAIRLAGQYSDLCAQYVAGSYAEYTRSPYTPSNSKDLYGLEYIGDFVKLPQPEKWNTSQTVSRVLESSGFQFLENWPRIARYKLAETIGGYTVYAYVSFDERGIGSFALEKDDNRIHIGFSYDKTHIENPKRRANSATVSGLPPAIEKELQKIILACMQATEVYNR